MTKTEEVYTSIKKNPMNSVKEESNVQCNTVYQAVHEAHQFCRETKKSKANNLILKKNENRGSSSAS